MGPNFFFLSACQMRVFVDRSANKYKTDFIRYALDERGWEGYHQYHFEFVQAVEPGMAVTHIFFKTNAELERMFGHLSIYEKDLKGLSITDSSIPDRIKIYFNADNWKQPPDVFQVYDEKGNAVSRQERLTIYRQYLVQHELGHALGFGHPEKQLEANKNMLCHPMHQQTKGTETCRANPWITLV
jgi:hypothetical protein